MAQGALSRYFAESRAPRYSIVFAVPLFILYELLIAGIEGNGGGLRNGADAFLSQIALWSLGARGPLILTAAIAVLAVILAWRDRRRSGEPLKLGTFLGMAVESIVLAALFGIVIGTITAKLLGALHLLATVQPAAGASTSPIDRTPPPTRLMLALGAGLYEELFFRVILVGGLAVAARVILGASRRTAGVFAVVIGALLFSAAHYIGPYGDQFTLQSFAFRALAGVAFSALYLIRGFGITAWTHALYDVFVMFF